MEYQKKPVNIKGYETYQCDTEGIVYGKNGKPLKPNINQHGYKYVQNCIYRVLTRNRKSYKGCIWKYKS